MTEAEVELAAIEYFQELGYDHLPGTELTSERASYQDVILIPRLKAALARINPHLDADTLDTAARKVLQPETVALNEINQAFQRHLTKGIEVQVRKGAHIQGDLAWLVDFSQPERNDWLVVSQLTVIGTEKRRADLVVYLNGLPMAVIELKNPEDENAKLESAWNQLQTYKLQIPVLFETNELLVITDGTEARVGSLTAGHERFGPWRTIDGVDLAPAKAPQMAVLIQGMFEKRRFLDYIRHFTFWDGTTAKVVAGYHQFHAVNKAVQQTLRAASPQGNKRVGVVWHTQGSGKSISMVFYAGKLTVRPELQNPTLVVITDRNDLDGQLYQQFCAAKGLFAPPVQAESREQLQELLRVASGGIVFTTLQKFGTAKGQRFPLLSDRRNIVVITDEAHRSQYEFVEGFARNLRDGLPNASFIGFTGTPIEFADKSTPEVFGDYIDTYTITQAVEDHATVPIYYEARLARIKLPEDKKPQVDEEFEEVTEGEEEGVKGKLKSRWARMEAMVGTEERLTLIARDIVTHFEKRLAEIEGKAMIVVMSRRIAVALYDQIGKLRPDWLGKDDDEGQLKVVMTGAASDPPAFQPHIRSKARLKEVEKRFKNAKDPLRLVIVRDMWLTGFDAPCAHTLYLDKPMQGHGLMQAIARVNRVFKDKSGGLVVDYLGLAEQLRKAVNTYGGAKGERPTIPVEVALTQLEERAGVARDMFHGFDFSGYFSGKQSARLAALSGGANHISGLENGSKRYLEAMTPLNKAVGIAMHLEGAAHLRDDVSYFQAVESNLRKYTVSGKSNVELDAAIRQIVSGAVASDGVMDVFEVAGLKKPDLSILSDQFLETVKTSPYKNLQLELLKKLLADEIKSVSARNVVQARKFSEMLAKTLAAYTNKALEAAQVILELIEMAKAMRDAPKRGEALGLTDDELAFYDALIDRGGVKEVMSDKVLADIAHDLVAAIRSSVSIDWTQKEAVRADIRRKVRRLLRRHGYPPDPIDQPDLAVNTVLKQAETLCKDWADVLLPVQLDTSGPLRLCVVVTGQPTAAQKNGLRQAAAQLQHGLLLHDQGDAWEEAGSWGFGSNLSASRPTTSWSDRLDGVLSALGDAFKAAAGEGRSVAAQVGPIFGRSVNGEAPTFTRATAEARAVVHARLDQATSLADKAEVLATAALMAEPMGHGAVRTAAPVRLNADDLWRLIDAIVEERSADLAEAIDLLKTVIELPPKVRAHLPVHQRPRDHLVGVVYELNILGYAGALLKAARMIFVFPCTCALVEALLVKIEGAVVA